MCGVSPWYVARMIVLNLTYGPLFLCYCMVGIPFLAIVFFIQTILHPTGNAMKRLRRLISWLGLGAIHVLPYPWIRIEYTDEEKLDPGKGYIVVCNHTSMSDIALLSKLPLDVIQVVKSWPFRVPAFGQIARLAGYVDVTRLPFDVFVEKIRKCLEQGVSVVAFPEGTRSPDGLGQFHSGIFRLALEVGCDIVPLCISGNEKMPQRGSLLLSPGLIRMRKLPIVSWSDYRGMSHISLKRHVRQLMADRLFDMAGA